MIGSSRSYAVGMAHFMIAGGWQALVIVCGVYLLLFGAGLSVYYYVDMSAPASMRSGLTDVVVSLLLVLETLALVIFGSFRVASAIRLDVSSKMIESHRLMPVPAWRAVLGYILGGTTHAIGFAALNVLLAFVFAGVTSTSLMQVAFNQAMLCSFAALVWTATALGTLMFRYIYFAVLAVVLVFGCAMVGIYFLLPGIALLISPLIGDTIFRFSHTRLDAMYVYPASLAAQGAFVALFFAGACRRYRGTYATTFNDGQALLVLLTWCFATTAGMALWDGIHQGFREMQDASLPFAQLTASLALSMIVSLVPITTLAARDRRPNALWPLYMVACIVGIAAIPVGLVWRLDPDVSLARDFQWHEELLGLGKVAITFFVVAAHSLVLFAALTLLRKMRPMVKWLIVGLGLAGYWLVPLVMELLRMMIEAQGSGGPERFGVLGTLSPLGLLINTWNAEGHGASPVVGLAVQCGAALILLVAMIPRRRSRALVVPPIVATVAVPAMAAVVESPALPCGVPSDAAIKADRRESGSP